MRRSLIHYWRLHLAVLLGAAVATAVLTGALLVGDSVRGSLRDLTLERLGRIDYALLSERFVRENIAEDLSRDDDFQLEFENTAPAILLNGNATHAKTRARAARINIHGVDHRFASLFDETGDSLQIYLNKKSGQIFPSLVINASLQQELNAHVGDQVLLNFEQPSDIHRESVLGDKRSIEVVRTLRLTVTKILPDRGLGRFGLLTQQTFPRNAFVPLSILQEALEEEHKTNAMFLAQRTASASAPHEHVLRQALRRTLSLEDLSLTLAQTGGQLALTSPQLLIAPALQAGIDSSLAEMRAPSFPLYTYLANSLTVNGNLLPYSTITALPPLPDEFGAFRLIDGSPAPALVDDEIFLNSWAAEDLQARPGDTVAVSYYVVGPGEQLVTRTTAFRVKGVIKIDGLAADPELTPEFPGIHEVDNMQSWDPPFPIDLQLIRPKDEAYWDEYRATPKAFIALATGQRLWQSRFGKLTAIRLAAAPGMDLQTTQTRLEENLLNRIQPEQAGFAVQAVKAQGLAASAGATDFSGLFIGFSFFLIVSATLLVGMLFRLGIEQRANELGLLRAVGFPQKSVTRRALQEAGVVAGLGCLLGLGGAIAYAGLLITGLRTWWVAAIGATFLQLHVNVFSLILGYVLALAIIALAIWLTLRQLRKIPAPAL
ncbi:ABC transporter permease, partial [candidate division KSB1 bacterium]|nr:ABC transporter permease [candidate division KSB1 bacterium]